MDISERLGRRNGDYLPGDRCRVFLLQVRQSILMVEEQRVTHVSASRVQIHVEEVPRWTPIGCRPSRLDDRDRDDSTQCAAIRSPFAWLVEHVVGTKIRKTDQSIRCPRVHTTEHTSGDIPERWRRRVPLRGISDEGLKRRFVADDVEVGVVSCHFAAAVPHVDCLAAKVFDCLGRLTGEALAAGDVVEEVGLIGACGDDLASQLRRLGVVARLVQQGVRAPTARLRACEWSQAARSRGGVVSRSPIRSAAGTSGQRTNRPRPRPDQAPTARCRTPASHSRGRSERSAPSGLPRPRLASSRGSGRLPAPVRP